MSSKNNSNGITRYITVLKEGFSLSPKLFFLKFLSQIVEVVQSIINLVAPKYLLLALKDLDIKIFLLVVLVLSGSNLCTQIISSFVNPVVSKTSESLNAKVMDGFLRKSVVISLSTFDRNGFYDKYVLTFEKCCELFHTTIDSFFQVLYSLCQIIIVIVVLSWMHPLYLCILFVFAFVQTIIGNHIRKINFCVQKKIISEKKKLNYIYRLFYVPEFMRDIRVNSLFDFIFLKKKTVVQSIINDTYIAQTRISKHKVLQATVSFVEAVSVLAYFGYMVVSGNIWYDTFIISQNSYNQMKAAIVNLLSIFNTLYENDLFAKEYFEYMHSSEVEKSGSMHLSSDSIQEIEFEKVCFSYPNSSRNSLQELSFKIKKGDKVLITGRNGTGKTTAIRLLLRLYTPTSGRILINGVDISAYDIKELRQSIAVLFQDFTTYAFTFYENLCLDQAINDNSLTSMIDEVGLTELFLSLKNGLDTPISCQLYDGGVDVSGGEKQRIGLGRVMLKKKSVIVLDEPTGNLDPESIHSLLSMMLRDKSRTLVIISHQLSYVQEMTRILCFESGAIVESGKHEELMKKNGIYASLYSKYHRSSN